MSDSPVKRTCADPCDRRCPGNHAKHVPTPRTPGGSKKKMSKANELAMLAADCPCRLCASALYPAKTQAEHDHFVGRTPRI